MPQPIRDLVGHLSEFDGDTTTLYARRPWTAHSLAAVLSDPVDNVLPRVAIDLSLDYVLEVDEAIRVLRDASRLRGLPIDHNDCIARLLEYAERGY
ncbi:MAG: hypothetical protein AAFV01_12475 [Bacteroidota bacterium]